MAVRFSRDSLIVTFKDGRRLATPLAYHRPLLKAKPAQRRQFEIIGLGSAIDWDDLGYIINVRHLLVPDEPCCD